MPSTWVHETHKEKTTGNAHCFATDDEARDYIDQMRYARDHSPVWTNYSKANIDWHIVEFDGNGAYEFIY